MDVRQFPSLTDHVRMLPAGGAGRDLRLHRLTGLAAAAEAKKALHAAATATDAAAGMLAGVLSSASAVWDGGRDDPGPMSDAADARDRLLDSVSSPAFLALVPGWIREMREIASGRPDTGACTLATALQLWSWTMSHFREGPGARGEWAPRAVAELTDALCPLLAARCLVLEVAGRASPGARPESRLRADLCHVQAAHTAASVGAVCAELVFGYRRHLVWDKEGCATCYSGDELDELEGLMPGIASGARAAGDVVEADGSHDAKAGPCVRFDGVDTFMRLRARLDGCLTGARLAKDRAAAALAPSDAGAATLRAAPPTGGQ
jgi:hypothetical protein